MKIVQLKAENVKRLKAIEITPKGDMVVIGGKNTAGKSSVLDSIYMALSGKKAQGKLPVRIGEEKATIECDLGTLSVKRTITPTGGGSLKVTDENGLVYQSPQSILDALASKLTFDPLAFTTESSSRQRDILKGLVGLDFTELDRSRKTKYEERTTVNRVLAQRKGELNGLTYNIDVPEEEPLTELYDELKMAEVFNDNQRELMADKNSIRHQISVANETIADMEQKRKELEIRFNKIDEIKPIIDLSSFNERIRTSQTNKRLLIENENYDNKKALIYKDDIKSVHLSNEIDNIDKKKSQMMSDAEMPIAGLSFDADGISYNEIPFDQCSSAEQLRVSIAMGIALNPKLNVLLIKNGSLLDDDNFALISDMASENDIQVWIERVGEDEKCSIIIEDGQVRGQ